MSFVDELDRRRLERGQVRADGVWWLGFLTPRPFGLGFLVVAACAMVPWLGFAAFALSNTNPGADPPAKAITAIAYFCMAPCAAPFAFLSVLLAGPAGARFLLSSFWLACGVTTVGSLFVATLFAGPPETITTNLVFGAMLLVSLGLGTALAALLARVQGRSDLRERRAVRIVALLEHFGSMDESTLVASVGGASHAVFDALTRAEVLTDLVRGHGRVWLGSRLRGRKAMLLAQLESGTFELPKLVAAVREPEPVLRSWLQELHGDGLYDVEIEGEVVRLGVVSEAPSCGGCGAHMGLVGRGLWRCLHCGNELAQARTASTS